MPTSNALSSLTAAALRAAHCWFAVDRVAGDEAATTWRRLARARQAAWRVAREHDIGSSPYRGSTGGRRATRVGSRLELASARERGLNFLTDAARIAAHHRVATPEPHQMLAEDRLWADLLSSMPLCFNVFGEAWREPERARRAVELLVPGAPPGDVEVIFEHSPGRLDPLYLGNRTAFDVAFHVGEGESRGIVGVETKYHEHPLREPRPQGERLRRYEEVAERSGVFVDGWRERILGTELQQIWQDHLLVLSMLQHPGPWADGATSRGPWSWGRFVLVAPAGNPGFARAAAAYREVLRDAATFAYVTLEELVRTPGVLADETRALLVERYL